MFDYKEMKKLMFLNEVLKHCGDTGMDVTIKRNPIYIKIKDIEVNEVDNKMGIVFVVDCGFTVESNDPKQDCKTLVEDKIDDLVSTFEYSD